ncbi:PREDICTED: probable G-protein coupled receptor Mth-like 8 [Rhagoletis zephyria]|uniref:probable G-protein coupled receptor Mth-like 8 n=1 Tax=Rhagoletis zephyria TaxID=28612 RepID=UPI0008119D5E|nr:PREDICTED: probable G-protein coupled receptor Mth-like 8 [Rhagoletis zephyria]
MSSGETQNNGKKRNKGRGRGSEGMYAPTLVRAIKSVRFDLATNRWPLMAAFIVVIIASCFCCCGVMAASGAPAAEVRYQCAFIDTINVTGTPWAYEQPPIYDTAAVTNGQSNNNVTNSVNINTTIADGNRQEHIDNNNNNNSNTAFIRSLGIKAIPRELIAAYDFIIQDGVRVQVERHLRACICKLKPCIRFCCQEGYYYDTASKSCLSIARLIDAADDVFNDSQYSVAFELTGLDHNEVAVLGANGRSRLVKTAQHFIVYISVPCQRMRFVPRNGELVSWTLFENGTIAHGNYIVSNYYCYTPHQRDNSTWNWQPLTCVPKKLAFVLGTKEWTYAICLILSVICMSIILFVYLFCTDIRNTFYGVAIKVYALCVIIGYSLLAHLTLTDPATFSKLACINLRACVILYLVLSFYVLSFMSFNFYMHFHGIILSRLMFWLIFFPITLVAVGWSIFAANNLYDISSDTCWFDPRNWSIMIYYYAPIFIACVLTLFFYILTLIHISERRDFNIRKATESLEENRFKSFWKFFSYTFLVFLVCVTSFAINYYREEWTHINYAVCLFIAFHGFGGLYALIGKNQQVQNFLRRIEEDVSSDDDDMTESAVPMSGF